MTAFSLAHVVKDFVAYIFAGWGTVITIVILADAREILFRFTEGFYSKFAKFPEQFHLELFEAELIFYDLCSRVWKGSLWPTTGY